MMVSCIYTSFLADTVVQQQQHIIDTVRRLGICVLPQYFNASFCGSAIEQIDHALQRPDCKIWRDELQADNRIMGIEVLAPELNIYNQSLIHQVINNLYGTDGLVGFILAGKIVAKLGNMGSGQGWHRDSVHHNQYKALVYLTDVELQHGPFEYFVNTFSERSIAATERRYGIGRLQNRLTEQDIARLPAKRHQVFCAKAGTLIFANTRGIHRGRPIEYGMRYALTTYSWHGVIPKHMHEFLNQDMKNKN